MNQLPPNVKDVLKKVGDETITGITVCRTPVNALVTGVIKAVASTPYDVLFHLFVVLHTDRNRRVLFEKNERINARDDAGNLSTAEKMVVPNPPQCTISQLITNTANYMGKRFIPYNPASNNCQDFITGMLLSNGVNDPSVLDFVKQDTASIFKSPAFKKFAVGVTDIAGNFNKLIQGGGKPKSNELSDRDIDAYLHGIKGYNGCFIKDELKKLKSGITVFNLNGNSHWVCMYKSGSKCFYFDSFGFLAPKEIERLVKSYVFSDKQIQGINESSCGFFVIAFARFLTSCKNKELGYNQFINLFGKPTHNGKILRMLIK